MPDARRLRLSNGAKMKRRNNTVRPLLVGKIRSTPTGLDGRLVHTIHVWCPHCKTHHIHGLGSDPRMADDVSHRQAHCTNESPFKEKGYYIGTEPET